MTKQQEIDEITCDYAAFTVDTCIFDTNGLLLDRGLLRQLHQFQESPIDLLMCDIVHSELENHLKQKALDAKTKVSTALKAANPHLGIDDTSLAKAQELLSSQLDHEIAKKRLLEFVSSCGAKIVKASDHIGVEELTDLYFSVKPPFEQTGDKKSEFPDAIALLTLEAWAIKNNKKILAVSSDRGWKAFAEQSQWIDASDDLAKSIAVFQSKNAPSLIAQELKKDLISNPHSEFLTAMSKAISDSLDGIDIEIEAHSAYYYEPDDVHAIYESHNILHDTTGKPRINLVGSEDESVVVNITCEVKCTVNASFDLQAWDSIDKEYLSLGSVNSEVLKIYQTDVLLTLAGDLSKGLGEMQIDDIEVTDIINHADFGEIEPDWGDEG